MSPGATNHDAAVQGLIDGYLDSIRQVLERSRLPGGEAASILDDVRTQILETLGARARGAPTLADAELWGMQKLFGWVSIATGLGQMATILILPIPLTILLLTGQIMLMGFIMLRSAR